MSWNPMFDECIKLKKKYIDYFGDYVGFKDMIETFRQEGISYNPIFNELQINQYGDLDRKSVV